MNQYQHYVYTHRVPETEEVIYVGMGTSNRAWLMGSGHRNPDHKEYLLELLKEGYLPYDWVRIEVRSCSKQEARDIEVSLIKKYDPYFNSQKGIGSYVNQEQKEQVKQLKSQGKLNTEISKILGISLMTVWRYLYVY